MRISGGRYDAVSCRMMRVRDLVVVDRVMLMSARSMVRLKRRLRSRGHRVAGRLIAGAGSHPYGHGDQGKGSHREQQQARQGDPGEPTLVATELFEHGAFIPLS